MLLSLKKYLSIFLKHFAPMGLFVFIPLLAALYLGHNIISIEQNKHFSVLSSKIEDNLKDIESEIAPESFLLKVARGAWFSFKKYENEQDKFWEYYENLCKFLKNEPDLYVFDEKGILVTPREINLKSRFLASKLWSIIDAPFDKKTEYSDRYKKQLKSFLGNEFRIGNFLDNRDNLFPIIVNTKVVYLYWMNYSNKPQNGILLVFWDVPSFELRMKEIIKRYSAKFDNGFIRDFSGDITSFYNKKHSKNSYYDNIFLKTAISNQNDSYIDSNGLLWKYIKIDDLWLVAGLKSKALVVELYQQYFLAIILFLAIAITSIYIWEVKRQDHYFSIRTKLIALFLIAVFTPVMGFSYLGYQYISDMRDNLYTEFGNESRDVLLNIDRELGASGNVFREDFRKIVNDFPRYDEDENIRNIFSKNLENHDLVLVERRLASDATIIGKISNPVLIEDMNVVTEPFSACCIDTTFNTNLCDKLDPVLKATLLSPDSAMSSFWQRPDNVQDFVFGTVEFYLYWCMSKSVKNEYEFWLILRRTDKVIREHMFERLKEAKTNAKERDFTIFVCNNKNGEWFPDNSLENNLKAIARRINYMGKPIETDIFINSKHYLLLGIKANRLRGYSLYALYPFEKIEDKINVVKYNIIAAILFFVIVASAIGYLLAGTFLYPVKRLEDGVKAIKDRNSEFRIEALQNDEFGGLANSFNKMISDLKEMELAKYIQDSLLPKSLPEVKGYQLSFSNKMASAVGGDYFDISLLDDDHLCIIIGDVSGHGVASALVMAIAKAVLYHGFNETRNLLDLLNDLNVVVNTYFSKPPVKKMITLFATIINLSSGKGVFVDAGHNFPMKISADGTITELIMIGLPIGIVKKIRTKNTDDYVLDKGETLVFYTDGIVEATGKTEEQYGYKRFKNNLSEMANKSSEYILKTLLDKYTQWENGTEPDDDVTLFILKRLSSQDDECNVVC